MFHADANRALLDRRVIHDLLGFNRDTYEGGASAVGEVVRRAVGMAASPGPASQPW